MELLQFCAPCLFGLEGILADELRRMGAQRVTPQNGRVLFEGDAAMLARANIQSRYAERIQLMLGTFRAVTFDQLFEGVKALPWEHFIGKTDRFPVKGWSLQSALHSIPDCQKIIKKAVVERLKSRYHVGWFEETGALYQIQFTILKDEVTLLIDTSGAGLHKRGYRRNAGGAPIKETLAAAIVDVTRARLSPVICDPCCGSGTMLIEAALAAKRIAPGIGRRFAAAQWPLVPYDIWEAERAHAKEAERPDQQFTAVGGDIDPEAVRLTKDNAFKAGVGDHIEASVRDLKTFEPQGERGIVLCNPPYGERLLDIREAQRIIRELGRVFVPQKGWQYAIISPDEQFEELFGRQAKKRRKLYNGMLKCQLYIFE
ncbi:MAG: class I SAM-dependent RNA methyltransferase [Ruminococcaceae bacterium]|nr:class I SAM-dependent RNA methyltransferase [Oscillospiraceae bacterium]